MGALPGASGPLCRVDHWLGWKLRKRAEIGGLLGASGPLARSETKERAETVKFSRNQAGLKIILFENKQVVSK